MKESLSGLLGYPWVGERNRMLRQSIGNKS